MTRIVRYLLIAGCALLVACTHSPAPAPVPAPVVAAAPQMHPGGITASVVGLYTKSTNEDTLAGRAGAHFGLYTYVLLGRGTRDQNKALLLATLPSTPGAEAARGKDPSLFNLIAIPINNTTNLTKDRALLSRAGGATAQVWSDTTDAILRDYDYILADGIRLTLCARLKAITPAERGRVNGALDAMRQGACGPFADGPIMVTLSQRLNPSQNDMPVPFLVFDFAAHSTGTYNMYVDAYKNQVKRADFSDGKKLHALTDSLVDVAEKINPQIEKLGDSIKGLLEFL